MNKEKKTTKVRLFVKGIFCGYRRSKSVQNTNQAILKIDSVKSREQADFYLGKKVFFEKKVESKDGTTKIHKKEGMIVGVHGNSGALRAAFKKNLEGQAIGKRVKVMMYPSFI